MTHEMKLNPRPFAQIAEGSKTIELRLYDEKRQRVRVGDTIVFTKTTDPTAQMTATVVKLHRFDSFAALYQSLPPDKCGYSPEQIATADPRDMERYYSPAEQAQYGVLGIEIAVI